MDTSWDNVEGTTRSQMLLRLPQVSRLSDIELPNKYHFFKLLLKHPRDQKKKKRENLTWTKPRVFFWSSHVFWKKAPNNEYNQHIRCEVP